MREANPRACLTRLIGEKNFVAARLYLKEADLAPEERTELLGLLAGAVVEELSAARRDDRERVTYLRSLLAWILRDVPGLGSLYREQLRVIQGGTDVLSSLTRGLRNLGDVAAGRKSVAEGVEEAADDALRSFGEATDQMRSTEAGERVTEFLTEAERGIREGIDQLGTFFRALNEATRDGTPGDQPPRDSSVAQSGDDADAIRKAARAAGNADVEDAEFEEEAQPINIERGEER